MWCWVYPGAPKPVASLFKKSKNKTILDKKTFFLFITTRFKRNTSSLDNFRKFKLPCSVYKNLHELPPPTLKDFKMLRLSTFGRTTRKTYVLPRRHTALTIRLYQPKVLRPGMRFQVKWGNVVGFFFKKRVTEKKAVLSGLILNNNVSS